MPYRWGGSGEVDVDCSGLVQRAFADAQIEPWASAYPGTVRRNAHQLYTTLRGITAGAEHPLPGDLAFYGRAGRATHVVLVTEIGVGGETTAVVGASSKLGRVVEFRSCGPVEAHRYRRDFLGFRRFPGLATTGGQTT